MPGDWCKAVAQTGRSLLCWGWSPDRKPAISLGALLAQAGMALELEGMALELEGMALGLFWPSTLPFHHT